MCTLLNASKTGFAWSNHIINRLVSRLTVIPCSFVLISRTDDVDFIFNQHWYFNSSLCLRIAHFRKCHLVAQGKLSSPSVSKILTLPNVLVYFGFYLLSASTVSPYLNLCLIIFFSFHVVGRRKPRHSPFDLRES